MEVCEMQKAETVLSILRKESEENSEYVFERLYRNLFNQDFYIKAYGNIYSKEGNMTPGTDGKTIDGFCFQLIEELIEKIRTENYYPNPVRRTYIPKKNGKLRPLGIPSFEDKLVQEVVKELLEAIYEPLFKETSHGYRENKSCHTALYQIKTKSRRANWFIEGNIKGFFDNVNQEILLKLVERKIKDGRFIELLRRFLKAGYFEFNKVQSSLSGTPQGGIISPILANIYLHELDIFMEEIKKTYERNEYRKGSNEYYSLKGLRNYHKRKGHQDRVKEITKQLRKMPTGESFDKDFIKINYVRYVDDFVVSVIGSKKLAEEIREKIKSLLNELKLELNMEKTVITNPLDERIKFLGYEISKSKNNAQLFRNSLGRKVRGVNRIINLLVPGEVIREKTKPFRRDEKPTHHNGRVNLSVPEIISEYNAEIRGLYNYYSMATDVGAKLNKYKYYHYYSMVRTIARKEKISAGKVIAKYGIDVKRKQGTGTRKIVGVKYMTKKSGEKTLTYFNEPLEKQIKGLLVRLAGRIRYRTDARILGKLVRAGETVDVFFIKIAPFQLVDNRGSIDGSIVKWNNIKIKRKAGHFCVHNFLCNIYSIRLDIVGHFIYYSFPIIRVRIF
jgi:group II intron reverse transcriptase/maturase